MMDDGVRQRLGRRVADVHPSEPWHAIQIVVRTVEPHRSVEGRDQLLVGQVGKRAIRSAVLRSICLPKLTSVPGAPRRIWPTVTWVLATRCTTTSHTVQPAHSDGAVHCSELSVATNSRRSVRSARTNSRCAVLTGVQSARSGPALRAQICPR